MKSGSKRSAARPPELTRWQHDAIEAVAGSALSRELVFGGGAALAALHLHHRKSEDLDFFCNREIEPVELATLGAFLRKGTMTTEVEVVGPRTSLLLVRGSNYVGRIDFAYYPFEPVGRRTTWRGLTVESLEHMSVNKLQAVLTRNQPRDFVDLYFLLREGPIRDLDELLDYVRAKFDVAPHRLGLAARLLLVREIRELPKMIRAVGPKALIRFFEGKARELARSEQA